MAFVVKQWKDLPDQSTPISAVALKDLETRLSSYADSIAVGGSTGLKGFYDVTAAPYNAVGDGVANDAAAINAAITYAQANGGAVYLPPSKTFFIGSTPLGGGAPVASWRLTGMAQGRGHLNVGNPKILWTGGAGSGPMVKVYGTYGFEMDHIHLVYDNPAYDGDMIDVDGSVHAADCVNWELHHLSFRGKAIGLQYLSARCNIRLKQAIIGDIHHCTFAGAVNCLRVGDPGGSYVVQVGVSDSTFNNSSDAHVLIGSADAEQIDFNRITFEAGNNTTAIRGATTALDGGQNLIYNMQIRNSWFGDASSAVTWIKTLHTTAGKPIIVTGNRFADNGSTSTPHLSGDGIWLIEGNSFEGGDIFQFVSGGATSTNIILLGNQAICRKKINNPSSSFTVYEWGNVMAYNGSFPQTTDNTSYDRAGQSRFAIGGPAKPAQPDIGSTTDAMEDLIWGAFANAYVLGNPVDKAMIMAGKTPNPSGLKSLMMFAPSAAGTGVGGVSIFAGTGPFDVFEVQGAATQAGCKIGFNGVIPIARPAAYTLNAGGTARNLPAGATLPQVETVLRQLLTDLQGYGLAQ